MVGVLVMQPVTIDPTHGIDVNAQRVIDESDRLNKPLLIIQSSVRDAQVNNVGKINPGNEPENQQVPESDYHPPPRPKPGRRQKRR